MTTVYRNLTTICLAAVLAFGLAACGGGSSTTPDPTPMPDPAVGERATIATAIGTAQTAVAAVNDDSTDAQVKAADDAITAATNAIAGATNVPQHERDANTGTVNALASRLMAAKASRTTAMDAADMAAMKATTAKAKALKAAIDNSASATPAVTPASIPSFDTDGDTATDASVAITLKKGDAAGMLGSWNGMDYAGDDGTTGDAKTTGMVRVYSNQEAAKRVTFASEAGNDIHGWSAASGAPVGDYTVVTTTPAQQGAVSGFPTTGTTSYDDDETVDGTFMKAPGTYTCTANGGCTSIVTANGINLGTDWTFTPGPGATLQQPDANYLRFGWWVRLDKDGPTHAGVFYGSSDTTALPAVTDAVINNAALVGKATYTGAAAGKFAISDPLRAAQDNSGHFTANAMLAADFKVTGSTLSGTIDDFRLNDGSADPGWSVELQKTNFTSPSFISDADAATADVTVWSINGAKSAASGSWQAQMFDETADDSNVPTSVVGSFSSSIGTTHSVVGAFGATKD